MLEKFCSVSNTVDADDFVGIRIENGKPEVIFPLGFSLSNDDEQTRRDIIHLLSVLRDFTKRREGDTPSSLDARESAFPLFSYQYIILDYLTNGYYQEKEVHYIKSSKGKINWKKTIQKIQPQLSGGNIVYLESIVKTNKIKENNLITQIHQYCVYESFLKFGWLYMLSTKMPMKPQIKFNYKLFMSVLQTAYANTFNSAKKLLFKSMMNIITQEKDIWSRQVNFSFGVYRFEYVWENMIDYVFGEVPKDQYFPHARWHLVGGPTGGTQSRALEPDTIIIRNNNAYILDAKYYKYGITRYVGDLPHTDSIQKQITYGEYLRSPNSRVPTGQSIDYDEIYNAFIMPFDCNGSKDKYEFVGIATADWKDSQCNYEKVVGLLLDTRHLIESYARYNLREIDRIIQKIENEANNYPLIK